MIKEFSAGGIVFFGDEVLLVTNFRQDVVFPKGHLEPGETALEAALREVAEEVGVVPAVVASLGETSYSYFAGNPKVQHLKTVYWFLMRAKDKAIRCDGYEIIRGQYTTVEEALELLTYDPDRQKLTEAEQYRRTVNP
ncbi:MAG: Diadenosine hexaphosphate hydrolase [Firmicutes bacterium]|nr:Diadenosine hexaphosphate hydrolase [Bacillota bacterium]MBT9157586.1 Diadenosine hexaphosphate hydrolase [Bacillota bacterium]